MQFELLLNLYVVAHFRLILLQLLLIFGVELITGRLSHGLLPIALLVVASHIH
jgi:hypothetical protein